MKTCFRSKLLGKCLTGLLALLGALPFYSAPARADVGSDVFLNLSWHPDNSIPGTTDPDKDTISTEVVAITAPDTSQVSHTVTLFHTYPDTIYQMDIKDFTVGTSGTVTSSTGDVSTPLLNARRQVVGYATLVGTFTLLANDAHYNTFDLFNNDRFIVYDPYIDVYSMRLDATGTSAWVASHGLEAIIDVSYNNWTVMGAAVMGAYLSPTRTPIGWRDKTIFLTFGDLKQEPNQPLIPQKCPTCDCGMAVASFDSFQAGIAITDTPISYTPGVGMSMNFTVSYHQRLNNEPTSFNYSNLRPQWRGSWISYISDGPANLRVSAVHHGADGNVFTYGGFQQTVVQGLGFGFPNNSGDFVSNQGWTHASLHYRQSPERYERWLPDGTVEIYAQAVGTSPNRLFFLTSIKDPQGNVTRLTYDPNAAGSGNAILTAVIDPTGSQLTFTYGSGDPLKITKVTRSKDGLSAKFQYRNSLLKFGIIRPSSG